MTQQQELAKRLDAAGWGTFILWVGIALMWDVGWGVGLLGIGLITLAGQAARQYVRLKPEGFWVVVGALFLIGGLGALYQLDIPMGPIVLMVVGLTLVISAFTDRRSTSTDHR